MVSHPYLTFSSEKDCISLRVSQMKPYMNRIKLPKDMLVDLTFGNGAIAHGKTSDSGFLVTFTDWPGELSRPADGNIFQTQVTKIKYWQEYDLENPSDT